MSFLHLSLIAGLAAITVPVLMHMFGQRQPQMIDFPALRFVRETTQEQSTSWQLRHFLLLLLRCLLLAALVFALARPRVHSASLGSMIGIGSLGVFAAFASVAAAVAFVGKRPMSVWGTAVIVAIALWLSAGLWGYQTIAHGPVVPTTDQSAPVAAAIIVDNGPTMAYRTAGESRLTAARDLGIWILDELPPDSRVGVLTGAPVGSLALDPSTAKTQVKIVQERGAHVDLLGRIRTALDLVMTSELERKEVYVLTDLSSSSWAAVSVDLQDLLDQYTGEVLLQIIDVGADDDANWQLGDAKADFASVPVGGTVTIKVEVRRAIGSDDQTATIVLKREDIDPRKPVIRDGELDTAAQEVVDRKVVDFGSGSSAVAVLTASSLKEGSNNFTVSLDKRDPLEWDNERFVSIPVFSQQPALVVASDPDIGRSLRAIIDPSASGIATGSESLAEQVQYVQLADVALEKYACVCLYDPPPLSGAVVQKLDEHVRSGAGLFIALGPQLGGNNGGTIQKLLPGTLGKIITRDPLGTIAFPSDIARSHPIFGELSAWAGDVGWNRFPIFQNYQFENLSEDSQVLMRVSDDRSPLVIFCPSGKGKVVTFTTPLPEPESVDHALWNRLWATEDAIPAFGLLLGTVQTLSGADYSGMDFHVGQVVSLNNSSAKWPLRYTLYTPAAQSRRVDAVDQQLTLGQFDLPGMHYLRGQRTEPIVRAFSSNIPAADTLLERMSSDQLDELLGESNYRIARSRDEVESSVGQARFGRELYPLLMTLVAGLFLAEQAMSNRFYKIRFSRAKGS